VSETPTEASIVPSTDAMSTSDQGRFSNRDRALQSVTVARVWRAGLVLASERPQEAKGGR
jgi:hypothetical protein